ncbi:hypothetical protein CEXT_95461 [Caerostris extrusa]|uniref:Uncharacterized protein n=1 Tax=Caerostris extrusa TaxID=172846 RepID=A0AAV4UV14_CAEEX|nr:hypothetical protein CEXT_95461 [Caerostris extrusa]
MGCSGLAAEMLPEQFSLLTMQPGTMRDYFSPHHINVPFIVFKKNGDEVGWPSSQFETNISKCDIWASFRTFLYSSSPMVGHSDFQIYHAPHSAREISRF